MTHYKFWMVFAEGGQAPNKQHFVEDERSKKRREQAERVAEIASRKILRLKLKTRGEWIKEAQAVFNAYIRARDQLAGHNYTMRPLVITGEVA